MNVFASHLPLQKPGFMQHYRLDFGLLYLLGLNENDQLVLGEGQLLVVLN